MGELFSFMGNKKICHLTLLNPAVHSRIFFKEGHTQAEAGYEVVIIGRDEAAHPYYRDGIKIIPLASFKRISTERYATTQRLLMLALQEQADLYQVHSPELLGIAKKLKKQLPKAKIVYDMHEDYFKNIRYGGYYSGAVRGPLSVWVRNRERNFAKWGNGVIYAEQCFEGIIPESIPAEFVLNKFRWPETQAPAAPDAHQPDQRGAQPETDETNAMSDIAQDEAAITQDERAIQAPAQEATSGDGDEGQAAPKPKRQKRAKPKAEEHPVLLYTGTIAKPWGILTTLELWSALNEYVPVHLVVAGHSHDEKLIRAVEKFVSISGIKERFTLEGGTEYVPFGKIVEWIGKCTAGTAFYEPRENIRDRIPTKFYEFMAQQKPLFFTENPTWNQLNDELDFGMRMRLPMREETIQEAAELMKNPQAYCYRKPLPESAWKWDSEQEKLLAFTEKVLQS